MKWNQLALGVTVCILLIPCSTREQVPNPPASPQKAVTQENAPALPKGLLAQWAKFQTALKTDDTKLLSEVTHFPLESNEFGGGIKSAKVLMERYATIFPAKTKECLLSSSPHKGEFEGKVFYEVYCDVGPYPIRFLFDQVGSQFFFTGIDNINE
jgi:hypothetical protein